MVLCSSGARAQEAGASPVTRTVTIPGTVVSFDLVRLPSPAGEDSESTLDGESAEVWMATTEATWDAFDIFVYGLERPADTPEGADGESVDAAARPTTPYIAVDRGFGHSGYPALSVSARNARAYCTWLSDLTGLSFRLPTTDEWVAACRADGDDVNVDKATLTWVGWYRSNSKYKTHPVARKEANAWGLHDLAGNVSEWVTAADGAPVLQGGSYLDGLSSCSCERSRPDDPNWNSSDPNLPKSVWWLADGSFIGFRVVCEGPLESDAVSDPAAARDPREIR
jgi:formylglycine-generating enzyme required for sulfatase activity